MILNPVAVRCGQSMRESFMTTSQPFCICCNTHLPLRTIPSFLVKWPPYRIGLREDGEGVQQEGSRMPESSSVELLHCCQLAVTWTSSRGDRGDYFDWISEQKAPLYCFHF